MKKSKKKLSKTKVRSEKKIDKVKKIKDVKHPIRTITLKFLILVSLVCGGLMFSDHQKFFNPDNINNHTLRKWNSYYDFTQKNDIDVLLVGNSHLYTGINPKNLSTALGCNAFILASPGTHVDDHYFALKEAIKISKPQLVVIETYGLKKLEPKQKSKGPLSDQFKSFSARKNSLSKITSMPSLFAVENYGYALSNTLRNHNFLYTNYDQIKKNINNDNEPRGDKNKLYLGRYIRFKTGIEDSILTKYKELGAPVNGDNYETNSLQSKYIKNIIELCESNDIEVIFLTLPMYEKHISNYDAWKSKLKETIGEKYSSDEYWIDMQLGEGYRKFTKASFESTYNSNQHMTYSGSLLATYKLVDFIQKQKRITLTNRRNDKEWIDLFYKEEGYLENNSPRKDDNENIVLYSSDSEIVKEILVLKKDKYNTLIAKVSPTSDVIANSIETKKIRVTLIVNNNGVQQSSYLDLPLDIYHSSNKKMNYTSNIKPVEILRISDIKFVD